jgi:hypothetical protein
MDAAGEPVTEVHACLARWLGDGEVRRLGERRRHAAQAEAAGAVGAQRPIHHHIGGRDEIVTGRRCGDFALGGSDRAQAAIQSRVSFSSLVKRSR